MSDAARPAANWAGDSQIRMTKLVLVGFSLAGIGYCAFSQAPTLEWACAALFVATSGGTMQRRDLIYVIRIKTQSQSKPDSCRPPGCLEHHRFGRPID